MAAFKKPRRSKPVMVADLFALERQVWSELSDTWRGLPDAALVQPGACGLWSVKDVMNHIATWQEATRRVLPELLQGRKPPAGQYKVAAFNAAQHAADQDRSITASRRRLNRSRRELLALLATAPAEQILDLKSRAGLWVKYATYGHYDEHLRDLQEYRRRSN